jgi:hypothetical protein
MDKNHQKTNPDNIIGKRILVGLTYFNKKGDIEKQIQKYGNILYAGKDKITFIDNDNNKEFSIPPDYSSIKVSDPDLVYELKSSNKKVSGVHLVVSFSRKHS